ncbi:MAG: hypothetical protein ABSA53_17330 [Streptosporangiaceae bacterium]|jgi:hypothetical protein
MCDQLMPEPLHDYPELALHVGWYADNLPLTRFAGSGKCRVTLLMMALQAVFPPARPAFSGPLMAATGTQPEANRAAQVPALKSRW